MFHFRNYPSDYSESFKSRFFTLYRTAPMITTHNVSSKRTNTAIM